jgi:ATP-binding cassette, subfamily B, multidrug efflux pump
MLRLFRFIRPYRGSVLLIVVLALAQSLANLFLPRLMADIVDVGIVKGDTRAILVTGGYMLFMAIGGTLAAVAGSFLSSKVASGFGRIIRGRIFERVSHLSVHQFETFSTASLITRTTNDTTQVQQVLIMLLSMVITAPMMAIGGVIMALSHDATLAWVLVAVIPVVSLVFFVIMGRAVPLFQVMQAKLDRLNLVLDEALTGVRVIRAFNREAHEHRRFDAANSDVTDTAMRVNRIVAFLMPSMMLMMNLASIAILWFGARSIDAGTMELGAVMASLQYAMQIMFAVFMVTAMFIMLPRAAAAAKRINEVLDVAPDVCDPPIHTSPSVYAPRPGQTPRRDLRGHVEFQNVSFRYPGAQEAALEGVTFTALPGEVTAIIGGTGSGKTTLAGLIPRFYDASEGCVLVDGVDVREMTTADLRSRIGYVPQKAVLFSGTIIENIRYGREHATEAEVHHAAAIAQATEFISRMPDGLNTVVAQGGTNLSGGQKQRLSIARALVRRPEIYVFDDTFSALDFATDARLRAALRQDTADATVFIVAQRVGTIMSADRIVVLDEGRVAGIGTHRELLKTNEVYREIVASQVSLEDVA